MYLSCAEIHYARKVRHSLSAWHAVRSRRTWPLDRGGNTRFEVFQRSRDSSHVLVHRRGKCCSRCVHTGCTRPVLDNCVPRALTVVASVMYFARTSRKSAEERVRLDRGIRRKVKKRFHERPRTRTTANRSSEIESAHRVYTLIDSGRLR